jgi:PKD repeat protein
MASPHVAGAAALYLSANPSATPAAVVGALTSNATLNALSNLGAGTPNRLLYVGFMGGGNPPPPPPPGGPVASFTKTCSSLTCTFTSTSTGSPTTTTWNFGDGSPTASGPTASHTFGARQNYTVTLTASNANGTSNTSQTVACNPKKCQ